MKRIFPIAMALLSLTVLPAFTACSPDDAPVTPGTETPSPSPSPSPSPQPDPDPDPAPNPDPDSDSRLLLSIGSASFTATLSATAAANAFKKLLPLTVRMDELNGNEKYCHLPDRLPTAASNPGAIHSGDLMLFGSDCLVLFYESFRTSYSYTRIGRLDNPAGLAHALGPGSVTVKFELLP